MKKKNTFILLTIMIIGTLYIGTAMPSVIACSLYPGGAEHEVIEECSLCSPDPERPPNDPSCETCEEAVDYAVVYMKDYVEDKIKGSYFLWRVDVTILIYDGLIKGFKESGFTFEIDEEELKERIEYWIDKTVGPQQFTVTLFLAKLGAIVIGITEYLISLCNGDGAKNQLAITQHSQSVSRIMSRFYKWIRVLYLLRF